jgi:hypothetical protein
MCPIVDGSPVNASNTNTQLLDAVSDDTALGKITLANTDTVSGTQVDNAQREHNSIASFVGKGLNTVKNDLPAWTNNDVGLSTDPVKLRADNLTAKFNGSSGHVHSGAAGDAPPIPAINIASVRLRGTFNQGTDLTGVTGSSTVVTTQMTGKTDSTGTTVKGVVVTAPNNKVVIRQASGTDTDDVYKDGSGNIVYGRITFSTPVWTLSYYVLVGGTETAYSFASASDVRWYYQELYNPITDAPVYSELATIPSDNATADVLTATTAIQGKTQLATAAPGEISATGSAGTANATVANADHTHKGVHALNSDGLTNIYGDVQIAGAGGTVSSQAGQIITLTSPALASTAPADVGSAAAVGVGTTSARADHVHRGVTEVHATSQPALYGSVEFAAGTGMSVAQAGQVITYTNTSPAIATRSGTPTIGSGVSNLSVVFSSALASTSYAVTVTMENTTDANPQFQPVTVTAKSTTGFSVNWNAPTDSANYKLNYIAIMHT